MSLYGLNGTLQSLSKKENNSRSIIRIMVSRLHVCLCVARKSVVLFSYITGRRRQSLQNRYNLHLSVCLGNSFPFGMITLQVRKLLKKRKRRVYILIQEMLWWMKKRLSWVNRDLVKWRECWKLKASGLSSFHQLQHTVLCRGSLFSKSVP